MPDGELLLPQLIAGGHHQKPDMEAVCAMRHVPVLGVARADIAEEHLARRHPLAEFHRELRQDSLAQPKAPEPFEGEDHVDPGILDRPVPVRRRCHIGQQPAQQHPRLLRVVDAEQEVGAEIGHGAVAQHRALDVVEFELNGHDGNQPAASSRSLTAAESFFILVRSRTETSGCAV